MHVLQRGQGQRRRFDAPGAGSFLRLFNPRTDRWSDHFELVGHRIEGRNPVGEVTVRIQGFNSRERLMERYALQEVGRFPSAAASSRL